MKSNCENKSLDVVTEASTLKALMQASRTVLDQTDFNKVAESLFLSCKSLIGATAGYVALMNEDGHEHRVLFLDSGGRPCTVDPSLPMPIRGLRAESYRKLKTIYDNNFSDSYWMEFMPDGHVKLDNVLFTPLIVNGKAVGLFGMANKPGDFNDHDDMIATAFSNLAAISLLNSMTLSTLKTSEHELEQYRDRLEEMIDERTRELSLAINQYRSELNRHEATSRSLKQKDLENSEIQKITKMGTFSVNLQDGKQEWSQQVFDILGTKHNEAVPSFESYIQYIHPDDRDRVRKESNDTFKGKKNLDITYRITRKDGAIKQVRTQASLSYNRDLEPEYIYGYTQDITEQKRLERKLYYNQKRYRDISDLTTNYIFEITRRADGGMAVTWVSKGFYLLTGYRLDDLKDLASWHDYIIADDINRFKEFFNNIKAGNKTSCEVRMIFTSGKIHCLLLTGKQNSDSAQDKAPHILIAAEDITDRKVIEEELLIAKENLEHRVKVRTEELNSALSLLKEEMAKHIKAEQALKDTEKSLKQKADALAESNSALKVLLAQRDKDHKMFEKNILSNIRYLIQPYITKLKRNRSMSEDLNYLNMLEVNLRKIVAPFSSSLSSTYYQFTPKEIQIADLIREGKQDKEITEMLNISLHTVKSHRKNIRKKLGIYGKRDNLRTRLMTHVNNR